VLSLKQVLISDDPAAVAGGRIQVICDGLRASHERGEDLCYALASLIKTRNGNIVSCAGSDHFCKVIEPSRRGRQVLNMLYHRASNFPGIFTVIP
jgi:hypothetical protein